MEKICLICKKVFQKDTWTSVRRWNEIVKTCSIACRTELQKSRPSWNKGKHYTKEQHERIFTAEWRLKNSIRNKGKKYPGRVHSEDTKRKISEGLKGHKVSESCKAKLRLRVGPAQSNWKGGISKINETVRKITKYKEWRKSVYERDNYTCQECGKCGRLHADHIKPFKIILREYREKYGEVDILRIQEYRPLWDISNGKTLCEKCHHKTETYGFRKI